MADRVVDASALAAVLFNEPGADAMAERLAGATLFAPALIEYEIGNTCRKKCRRHPAEAAQLRAALEAMAGLDLKLLDVDLQATLRIAERHALSFYDASYLWVAQHRGAPLVSLDSRLVDLTGQGAPLTG
jgi:predicted nucleic acid-binding protein